MTIDPPVVLRQMFDAAVTATQPAQCVPTYLPAAPKGRLLVLGAGKALAAKARAVEDHWQGPLEGLEVTRHGYAVPCARIRIAEVSHLVPDAVAAARQIYELTHSAGPDETILCLISGGGSALLLLPLDGISLEDKQVVTQALLKSGAKISEMNCIRRHLLAVKGRHFAAAAFPAKLATLLISDAPGDTDGIDGLEEAAGAVLMPDSLERAWRAGISPRDALADNDCHGFFGALGDAVVTGPTRTNVNDFRAILIAGQEK
jgi:glycerate 2-kinase